MKNTHLVKKKDEVEEKKVAIMDDWEERETFEKKLEENIHHTEKDVIKIAWFTNTRDSNNTPQREN